jgi:biotin carboxylase
MIVLVDPVSTGPTLSAALVERGENPLHLYAPQLREAYACDPHPNKWLMKDPVSDLRRLSAESVRAVIAGSEWGVTAANHLAHALGLPHHLNSRVRARRDKAAMNYALQDAGLPAARTVYVREGDDIASALAGFDFPVVVKPVDSAGADGCAVCADPTEVFAAVRAGLGQRNLMGANNSAMVIQDYLDGPQFIVNTVSLNGRHLLSDLHSVRIDQIGQRSVLRHSLLVTSLDEQATALVAFTLDCLDAVGIREGAAHTEVRMTHNGPRLIEVNARIMGASLQPALYRGALGYNQADLVAERFTDPDTFAKRFTDRYAPAAAMAMAFLCVEEPGTVVASPGVDHVRVLPGFHSMEKMPEIGATIDEPWLCTGQAGMAYFLHRDRGVIANSLAKLHRLEDNRALHDIRPHLHAGRRAG